MNEWRIHGAEVNARWCDLVVTSQGGHGSFAQDAWTSPAPTPPLFPDAITLIPSLDVPDLLSRVDSSPGCTVKDSFASLDLVPHGFRVLFDAQWIVKSPRPESARRIPSDWTEITDPYGLRLWELAWCGGGGPQGLFVPELLSEEVFFLGRIVDNRVVAGGIVNTSADAAGISNVFADAGHTSDAWSALTECAQAIVPDVPLIGYERDEALAGALNSGFQATGPLRVWITDT
jgi:hypothetical protein